MALIGRKRARMADRDRAVEVINAAYAEGQLTVDEREDRVHRALLATHLGDLDQVMSDLQKAPPQMPGTDAAEPTSWWGRTSRRTKLGIAGALLVVVGGGVAIAQMGEDDSTSVGQPEQYFVPATAEAVEDLIADQEAEFGTTRSYGVNLQAQLSTVDVPTDDGRARYQQWMPLGDGTFRENGEITAAGDQIEFDLADVDLEALDRQIERAWTTLEVPDPTYATLVIQHWDQHDEPRISINVTNEYEEYGYVVTDLAGRVMEQRPFDPTSP